MPDRVLFWASLTHRVEGKLVPYTRVSPSFGTEPEMVGWVRANRRDGDEIDAYRRVVFGGDFTDERLIARDEDIKPDPARLRAIMAEMTSVLGAKKRELDAPKKARP